MPGSRSSVRKIDFPALRLIGRDEEIDRLEAIYEAIAEPPDDYETHSSTAEKNDCILIAGQSGCGKTKLVESLRCTVLYSGGTFISPKFDQLSSARPYSALVDAIGGMFQSLARVLGEDIKSDITGQQLDSSDLSLLYALAPRARAVLQSAKEEKAEQILLEDSGCLFA